MEGSCEAPFEPPHPIHLALGSPSKPPGAYRQPSTPAPTHPYLYTQGLPKSQRPLTHSPGAVHLGLHLEPGSPFVPGSRPYSRLCLGPHQPPGTTGVPPGPAPLPAVLPGPAFCSTCGLPPPSLPFKHTRPRPLGLGHARSHAYRARPRPHLQRPWPRPRPQTTPIASGHAPAPAAPGPRPRPQRETTPIAPGHAPAPAAPSGPPRPTGRAPLTARSRRRRSPGRSP